jgi:hypothetical protein
MQHHTSKGAENNFQLIKHRISYIKTFNIYLFVVMVHGKTVEIITDVTKTSSSILLYTSFIMLHKFSEDYCTQWLKHAAAEQRLSKTVLLCTISQLFVVFMLYVSWDIHMTWLTVRSCHPGMNFSSKGSTAPAV